MALAAALDRKVDASTGAPLPPFWHHLYGHGAVTPAGTGEDGHPKRGGFLPDLPGRRMWAGSDLTFEGCLRFGDEVARTSRVAQLTPKQGKSGPLVLVKVEHEHRGPAGRAVEAQTLAYVEGKPKPSAPQKPEWPTNAARVGPWRADSVLLFRYSALTGNGHRVHYDADYARGVEGYPNVVVHGPLLATLMLEAIREKRPGATVASFWFRAISPAFRGAEVTVRHAEEANSWRLGALSEGCVRAEGGAVIA